MYINNIGHQKYLRKPWYIPLLCCSSKNNDYDYDDDDDNNNNNNNKLVAHIEGGT
jgi:hypothetical protein